MKDIIKLNNTLEEIKNVAESLETTLDSVAALNEGRRVDTILGNFAVSDSATSKTIGGKLCTVNVLSGQIWINPDTTAVADATSIKLTGSIDLIVEGDLSLISDSDGANVQIIVWS